MLQEEKLNRDNIPSTQIARTPIEHKPLGYLASVHMQG